MSEHSIASTPVNGTSLTKHSDQVQMAVQLRVWQQQPSKAVLEALNLIASCQMDSDQQAIVLAAVTNPVSQLLPPSTAYLKRLIRLLIQHLEDQKAELSEQLLNVHIALLMGSNSTPEKQDSPWRYKTFYYSSNPSWQQLQDLQQQHVQHCLAVTRQHGSSSMPTAQLLQLQQQQQQQQQQMLELLTATGQQHAVLHSNEHCCDHQSLDGSGALTDQLLQQGYQQEQEKDSQQQQQLPAGVLSIHMSENLFEGSTGCHMWDAGFLLAEFVLNHPHLFKGKRCIEIGCGPGFVASCLCRVGTGQLLLTDGDSQTLVNCISNLNLNGHGHAQLVESWQEALRLLEQSQQQLLGASQTQQVMACPLDWHEGVPGLYADVVVGSDICYDPEAVPSLVRLLQQLLGAGQVADASAGQPGNSDLCGAVRRRCVAYISTTKRQDTTLAKFKQLASEHGIAVEQVNMQPHVWAQQPACFQELPVLQEREQRFILHRLKRAGNLPAPGHRA